MRHSLRRSHVDGSRSISASLRLKDFKNYHGGTLDLLHAGRIPAFQKPDESGARAMHCQKCSTGTFPGFCYRYPMSQVAELLKEASNLDLHDRAELVSSLLEDLDSSPHHVSDEEALPRLEDLKFGRVKGLSEEEFWKACGRS